MEIEKVRDILRDVALDHSGMPADESIKILAVALGHIAEAIHGLENDSAAIRSALADIG